MTREEAIAALKARCHYCEHFPTCVHDKPECFHAAEMAIKSLEAWDTILYQLEKHRRDMTVGRNRQRAKGFRDAIYIILEHLTEVDP